MNKYVAGLLYLSLAAISVPGYAQPLSGTLRITGGIIGSSGAISGDVDPPGNIIRIDPTTIYGAASTFLVAELLAPGTYTRTFDLSSGGTVTRTATVPTGKLGAYFVISSAGFEYQLFNAWTVSADGLSFTTYNIPGNTFIGGKLDGKHGITDFTIPAPPEPGFSESIDVTGGFVQECAEHGGTTVDANVTVVPIGGAVLDRVEWYLDDVYQGTGSSRSVFIPLGLHDLRAVAIATNSATSASASATVQVRDTTAPTLNIVFLDASSQSVTSAGMGSYRIHYDVQDVCDAAPSASGSAKPVMEAFDGDSIVVNPGPDVILPTTAVEVTATAIDASGNKRVAQSVLTIQ